MSFSTNREQFTINPKTPAQWRDVLSRIKGLTTGFETRVAAAETAIALLQAIDPLVPVTNANASPIVLGQPVYVTDNDTVDLARANALSTSGVLGLVQDNSIAASGTGDVLTSGHLTGSTAQWDAVTGGTGGLTANSIYYLSATTAGRLTATPPSTSGHVVVEVGKAVSTTTLKIAVILRIRL